MPIRYEIERLDEERGLVRTTCSGQVDLDQVIEHFRALQVDPLRPRVVDVLLDLVAVDALPDRAQVQSAADEVGRMLSVLTWGRLAVVAATDVAFGVSRMFETLSQSYFSRGNVFRSREEAEAWLAQPPG